MGVDIRAWTNIRKVDAVFDADGEPIDPVTRQPFEGHARRMHHAPAYSARADGIEDGAVYVADAIVGHASRSYGGYNFWRDKLAELAGWPLGNYEQYGRKWDSYAASAWAANGGNLWELINFSDCEGVIGPETCRKIARELEALKPSADAMEDPHFKQTFNEVLEVFNAASGNGCVVFS